MKKYKYSKIIISFKSNKDYIKIQKLLINTGLIWYSGQSKLLYKKTIEGYFCVNVHIKCFGIICDGVPDFNDIEIDNKLYTIYDLANIKSIIINGIIIPLYKSRNINKKW